MVVGLLLTRVGKVMNGVVSVTGVAAVHRPQPHASRDGTAGVPKTRARTGGGGRHWRLLALRHHLGVGRCGHRPAKAVVVVHHSTAKGAAVGRGGGRRVRHEEVVGRTGVDHPPPGADGATGAPAGCRGGRGAGGEEPAAGAPEITAHQEWVAQVLV